MLRWRSSRPGFETTAVRDGGDLIGLAVSRTSSKQWQICDLLTRNGTDALQSTLAAVCDLAQRRFTGDEPYRKVAILATPFLQGALKTLGFERDAYDFPLVVHALSPELPLDRIAPGRWYASAND